MTCYKKELSVEYFQQRIQNVKDLNPDMIISENHVIAGRLMVQAANNMERQIELNMANDGLVGAAWMVLIIIYSNQEQKVIASDICDSLDQNKSTTSRIIESLIEKQFVIREADSIDRRKTYLHITAEGKIYVEKKLTIYHAYMDKVWEGVDVDALLPQMSKLLANTYKTTLI